MGKKNASTICGDFDPESQVSKTLHAAMLLAHSLIPLFFSLLFTKITLNTRAGRKSSSMKKSARVHSSKIRTAATLVAAAPSLATSSIVAPSNAVSTM